MLSLLPIPRLLALVAISYAALIAIAALLVQYLSGDPMPPRLMLSWAISGGATLQILLTLFFRIAWRWLWRLCPKLNDWLFPDLNGTWTMRIEWHGAPEEPAKETMSRRRNVDAPPSKPRSGVVLSTATIVQDWLGISIEVKSPDSTSQTLSIAARKDPESKRFNLSYLFRVEPRGRPAPQGLPYRGAAILRHERDSEGTLLKGKYWTERHTVGEYELRREAKPA